MSTNNINIFELATRAALRFESPKGPLSVEDLWKLPLSTGAANLDQIAQDLDKKLKANTETKSFVKPAANKDDDTQLKFDIVLHIINVKVADRDAAAKAKGRAEKRQQLLALLEQKENEKLSEASADEIRKMLAEMEKEEG